MLIYTPGFVISLVIFFQVLPCIFIPVLISILITFQEDLDDEKVEEPSDVTFANKNNSDKNGNLTVSLENRLDESAPGSEYSLNKDCNNSDHFEHMEMAGHDEMACKTGKNN